MKCHQNLARIIKRIVSGFAIIALSNCMIGVVFNMSKWTAAQASALYNVSSWGSDYFQVSKEGHLQVGVGDLTADLKEMVDELREQRSLQLPLLLRINNILRDRVHHLCEAFNVAIDRHQYQGSYTSIYPIKVNQQRSVVEQIAQYGGQQIGFEAGSKPELIAVLGVAPRGARVVCNGYKDREFIRFALIGQQLGHDVYIVLERTSELRLVIAEAKDLGVVPQLGVRVRLSSTSKGNWQNTGGEKGKFGHSASQLLDTVTVLKDHGLLGAFELLHFHLGSQIANIADIRRGVQEASRYFVELNALGVTPSIMDVGGGLGVDYEGARSRNDCSMNYSVAEYANTIVSTVGDACDHADIAHPDIVTEAGRAQSAHHAVLVTNVIDVESTAQAQASLADDIDDQAPAILRDMSQAVAGVDKTPVVELYHEAEYWLTEIKHQYLHGLLTLEQRVHGEQLYFRLCDQIKQQLDYRVRSHRDILDELGDKLADKYFCNFSVFQSTPDVWALNQIFPIMPIHRLDEAPTAKAVLQDLTCDSDGCISHYVEQGVIENALSLHELKPKEDYLLGIFLVGAYQEILGDMHNLFGDTDAVNVELTDAGYAVTGIEKGDQVDELLEYVHYSIDGLHEAYQDKLAQSNVSDSTKQRYLEELQAGLSGYTYLED